MDRYFLTNPNKIIVWGIWIIKPNDAQKYKISVNSNSFKVKKYNPIEKVIKNIEFWPNRIVGIKNNLLFK